MNVPRQYLKNSNLTQTKIRSEQSPKFFKCHAESHWSPRQKRKSVILMVSLFKILLLCSSEICLHRLSFKKKNLSRKCFFHLNHWVFFLFCFVFWHSLKFCVQSPPRSSPGFLHPLPSDSCATSSQSCGHSGPRLPHKLRWSDRREVAHDW